MMNKKEQAEMQQLRDELRLAKALRFTEEVATDVPLPSHSMNGLTTGWTFNSYNDRVEVGCSSSTSHSFGRNDKTTAQHPLALYSSKLRALRALRASVERIVAKRLADIDLRIADEEADL